MTNSRGEPVGRVPGTFIDTTATGESVEPSPAPGDRSLGAPRPGVPNDSLGNPRDSTDTTRRRQYP